MTNHRPPGPPEDPAALGEAAYELDRGGGPDDGEVAVLRGIGAAISSSSAAATIATSDSDFLTKIF